MKQRKNNWLILVSCFCGFGSYAQISNNGALITVKNQALISSSMDINNTGQMELEGILELKGKRKITSEYTLQVHTIRLNKPLNLDGNLMVHQQVDFGEEGLIDISANKQITLGPEANYINYSHGKGVLGKVKKMEAKNFIFPLGTLNEAFPVVINEANTFAEASILTKQSVELGDFDYNNLENPNMAVIEINSDSNINPNQVKLNFDDQKEEVVLKHGFWTEAKKTESSNNLVLAKAMIYNKGFDLERSISNWVKVFPNPSTTEINIDLTDSEKDQIVNFRVIDIRGSILLQEKKKGNELNGKYKLPSNLQSATYLLEFENEKGKRRIIKQTIIN